MGTITSNIGLISGINTGQIIDELMQLESQPVTALQARIASTTAQKGAFQSLVTQLQAIQTTGQDLQKPATFNAATANSSNENVLTATADNGAAVGTYNLQVAQLVTTQQLISQGFSDFNQAHVGAGTITIETGGGGLTSQTTLGQLNGGQGVPSGQFRITDRSGATAVIDTSSDVTLDDVLKQINNSLSISVHATVKNDQIVLTDTSGKTASDLTVSDLGNGTAAAKLGIAGDSANGVLTGTDINYLANNTSLTQINDGRGLRLGTGGPDLTFTLADGSAVNVNLAAAKTVGDVLTAINTAGGTKLKADIAAGSNGIRLTDSSGGGGTLSVADANGSHAAEDLGIATTGNVINGKGIIAGIDTTLLSSLRGGQGLSLGTVNITDRSGDPLSVNFSGANTVQDLIDAINTQTGGKIQASLKQSGNGIQITDTTGGTGNLVVADAGGGQTATQLGLAGTFASSTTAVAGADLQKQWVTNSTLLSSLNGGKGIAKGQISITNAAGATTTVDLSSANITTVSDVLYRINNSGLAGVTASINTSGNGILISDSSGGAGKLSITDKDATTASDLNIKGTATGTTIDGAYEKTITVGPNDTLTTVQQAINNAGFGVTAQIINDGSASSPYRLSLTAKNSGLAGSVVLDTGTTNLGTYNLVDAQDAAVFLGGTGSAQPLLVTASSNQITGIIQGVTLNLNGVSDGPVQLNVTNDPTGIIKSLNDFTTNFNSLVDNLSTLTQFDTTTNTGGVLLGDSTAQQIQTNIYTALNTVVQGAGQFKTLADIGITVGDGAKLTFDENTFREAFAEDPQDVQALFNATKSVTDITGKTTTTNLGVGYAIDSQITTLIDPVNGIVTQEDNTLDQQATQFQSQIDELNQILADKKARLQEQFANMESVLAGLQTQQSALASFTGVPISTTPAKTSS